MKKIVLKIRDIALFYLKWGWPLLLTDAILETWAPATSWRSYVNTPAFIWILCAPVAPLSLLLDRERRERVMARLCGVRDGDERERVVTGEAARATLLLGLSLQVILLVMSLVSVRLSWDPNVPKGEKHGLLSVGMSFSSTQHLDPFGTSPAALKYTTLGASPRAEKGEIAIAGGFLLTPSAFPVLALLILTQVAAFKLFALCRYEGTEA